jgi:hypothetical protein
LQRGTTIQLGEPAMRLQRGTGAVAARYQLWYRWGMNKLTDLHARIPLELMELVDERVDAENEACPTRRVTKAEVVRELLYAGLGKGPDEPGEAPAKPARGRGDVDYETDWGA